MTQEKRKGLGFVMVVGAAEPSITDLSAVWPDTDIRLVDGKACVDQRSLFEVFQCTLQFPEYFGRNWDAFEECLQDLSWIESSHVAVAVLNADLVTPSSQEDFKLLVEILERATRPRFREPHFPELGPRTLSVGLHASRTGVVKLRVRLGRTWEHVDEIRLQPD